jgi:hypothetical protein
MRDDRAPGRTLVTRVGGPAPFIRVRRGRLESLGPLHACRLADDALSGAAQTALAQLP